MVPAGSRSHADHVADPYLPPDGYDAALGWWDAMHDEGALVAWGLWAAGR